MIILDTNIVSEAMRPAPLAHVIQWLNEQPAASLFLSTISIGEIFYGLRILPHGKKRRDLETKFQTFVTQGFKQRILPFSEQAAHAYGEIMGHQREIGRPMTVPDGQIAAIAKTNQYQLATRNTKDFESCGIQLINPFER